MNSKALGVFCVLSVLFIVSFGVNIFLVASNSEKEAETGYSYDELIEAYNNLASDYENESAARESAEASLEKTTTMYNSLATDYNKAQDKLKEYKTLTASNGNDTEIDVEVPTLPKGAIGWIYIPSCDVSAFMHYGSTMEAIANKYVGEFEDTGEIGVGNYCVLGHSNERKKYIFSDLAPKIKVGDAVYVYKEGTIYKFEVGYFRVVDPDNVWILTPTDTEQATITIMCCADSGQRRFVVFGNFVSKKEVSV